MPQNKRRDGLTAVFQPRQTRKGRRAVLAGALLLAALVIVAGAAAQSQLKLSKEYVYAGGRLVATEEPTPSPTPTPTPTPSPTPTPPPTLPTENVFWTVVSSALQVTGNSLTRVQSDAMWDAGAVSSRSIGSGDGYMEFTPGNALTWRMAGLNSGSPTWGYTDLEYALFMAGDGTLHVYESGQDRGVNITYAANDRLRVAVESGHVKYYQNNNLIYTSAVTPSYPLMADATLNTQNSTVNNATISGNDLRGVPPPENIYWTTVSPDIQVTGNSLTRTQSDAYWDAGAVSSRTITSGDGYMEFTPGNAVTWRMAGLNSGSPTWGYTDLEYAFFTSGDGTLHVYESGNDRGVSVTYAGTDRLRVAIEGGQVKYYQNNNLLYTSSVAPSYPLMADATLNTQNSTVNNATIAAEHFGGTPAPENVAWGTLSGDLHATGNSLSRFQSDTQWDAGATSTRSLASGDGYVEFTPGNAVTWRMAGLNSGSPTWGYTDLEFAFFMAGDGTLHVYESGQDRGISVTYAANDRLRVAVESGHVKYYKNGALVYTSGATPSYPLMFDATLNTQNSTVNNVTIAGTLTP